ncbi:MULTISPECIES: PleD family two-component system response regulator [unclassified Ruegeria]|uniref:response regulator n=1 Tax=unclassified Ruegeria TaxID=2625375 RepID=UPI0014890473|nr:MULTISPECIES: response regulator [unclassified Ruegeria]
MRILAVDDDPSILELLESVLAAFGYEDIVTARSGQEALDILNDPKEVFDCLLLDVQMPQMNGIALCEEARKLPGYTFTPIIMVTAMVQKQYIDEAFEAGATDYVTKPFEFSDLKQRLGDAYRMAAERRAAIEVFEADGYTWQEPELSSEMRLSDPLFFGDLPGCMGLSEFENYVIQLSTMHSMVSKIVAIKVADVERIFQSSSAAEFRKTMGAAGAALLMATKNERNFATYWGNGVFLLLLDSEMELSPGQLRAPLSEVADSSSTDTTMAFQVGKEVALKASSKMEALFLIDKAVEMAEMIEDQVAQFG